MLKRQQVLLNDWLSDYIKHSACKYDVSFSEVIRLTLCLEMGRNIAKLYPKYKFDITDKELKSMLLPTSGTIQKDDTEKRHKFISKVYFEARKAIEFAMQQEEK